LNLSLDPIRPYLPIVYAVGVALILSVTFVGGCNYGGDRVQAKWDKSVAKGKAEVERLKSEAGKVTVRVETKTVEVVRTVKVKGDTIVRQVPIYISRDLPELPGAFRVLHDAAATGALPNPASFPDATPIAPQDVASTTADNYTACRVNAATLAGLQEWVREQHKVNPEVQ
jgi:hypothetical protein